MRREFGVAGSWGSSRAELSRELGRAEPGAEPSRVEPSRVELGVEPGVERPGSGGFVLGLGLQMSGVGVAIGCVIYECLEHEVDMYATVMFSYSVCMLILFRCVCKDSWGPWGRQVCGSEVETTIYTGDRVMM